MVGALENVAERGRATAFEAFRPAMERPNATVTSVRFGGSNSR